ncbi:MAG: hypothetical protein P1U67_11380 [Alcanivoracaceae bacterium]|nr:hypothetical protein [Alcanivoracaceae bacterium]
MKPFISRLCRRSISLHAFTFVTLVVLLPGAVTAEPDLSEFPSHKNVVDITDVKKPALHESIRDPDFGSKITRVTDISQVKGVERLRHYYAKRNPFNADESRAVFVSSDGYNWVFDTITWEPVRYLPLGSSDAEVHWHPTDKDKIFLVDFGSEYNISRMFWLDAKTGKKELLLDMEKFGFIAASGMMEGNPDKDMTVYAVAGNTKNKKTEIALVDLNERKIISRKEVDPRWVNDWISVSPSGKFVVTMGEGFSRVFDRDLKLLHTLPEGSYGHGDLCLTPSGREALVFDGADLQLNGDRNINIAWLDSGKLEIGTRIGWGATPHVSCRNFDFPGWALISTQGSDSWSERYKNMNFEIFWLKLDGSGEIRRVAHHHSSRKKGGYFAEQHAVTNRDGTKILFSSNWNGEQVDEYLIELPSK